MLKTLLLLTSTAILLFANDKVHSFAKNEECKTCHSQIYNEFEGSMHTPFHKKILFTMQYGANTRTIKKSNVMHVETAIHQQQII